MYLELQMFIQSLFRFLNNNRLIIYLLCLLQMFNDVHGLNLIHPGLTLFPFVTALSFK